MYFKIHTCILLIASILDIYYKSLRIYYESIIPTLYMVIKLKVFENNNKCPTLGVEPVNIFLVGRENSH